MTRFNSFVPSKTHFILLSSFIFKICASSRNMPFRHQASQKLHRVNTSLISLCCTKDLEKKRLILPRSLWNSRKSKKRSQIKPRNHEEANIQGFRNALGVDGNAMGMMDTIMTQTYYYDVARRPRFGTITSFLDFSRLEHAQATHEHTEQPTTQLVIRKRFLRRRKNKNNKIIKIINYYLLLLFIIYY